MGNGPITLDFSKAQLLPPATPPLAPPSATPPAPVKLDFNNAEPIPDSQQANSQQQQYEKAIVPAWSGGFISVDVPQGQARNYEAAHAAGMAEGGKIGLGMLGAAAGPELLPEMDGGGLLGYLGRLLLRSGAAGVGAGVGNATGQALSIDNPFSLDNLKETGRVAATTAALSLPLEAIGQIPFTKLGRSAINQSVGAQTRDVFYGSPALALTKEGISNVSTGDWQAYRQALTAGQSPLQASQAAGGRFAAVNQRIAELTPQLDQALSASNAQIPVADAIDKPLNDSALNIIMNPAMKDAAINQIGALQKAVKTGLGPNATPSQLQVVKQAIGNRVNWGGDIAVTDEVKPAYRALYGSLKDAIHTAVPDAAPLDERLTNLLAAQNDLDSLARAEEVGRGGGVLGGKIGPSLFGLAAKSAGRVLPAATNLSGPTMTGASAGLATPLSTLFEPQQ